MNNSQKHNPNTNCCHLDWFQFMRLHILCRSHQEWQNYRLSIPTNWICTKWYPPNEMVIGKTFVYLCPVPTNRAHGWPLQSAEHPWFSPFPMQVICVSSCTAANCENRMPATWIDEHLRDPLFNASGTEVQFCRNLQKASKRLMTVKLWSQLQIAQFCPQFTWPVWAQKLGIFFKITLTESIISSVKVMPHDPALICAHQENIVTSSNISHQPMPLGCVPLQSVHWKYRRLGISMKSISTGNIIHLHSLPSLKTGFRALRKWNARSACFRQTHKQRRMCLENIYISSPWLETNPKP